MDYIATNGAGKIIDERTFSTGLTVALDRYRDAIFENWTSSGAYTEAVLRGGADKKDPKGCHRSAGIFRVLGEELQFGFSHAEYDKIDCAYFNEIVRDDGIAPNYNVAAPLQVILEHENNAHASTQEVAKLALWDCPLKVLITYPRGKGEADDLLRRYLDIIEKSEWHPARWLVVFGYRGKDRDSSRWDRFLKIQHEWLQL